MDKDLRDWLEVSKALLQSLLPQDAGLEVFGVGMAPVDFAALVEREAPRVDHALTALATAAGEAEARAVFRQLEAETVIALFSRWAHYTKAWQSQFSQADPQHWLPPHRNDWWRAVFLSMTGENWYSTDAVRTLWPMAFATRLE